MQSSHLWPWRPHILPYGFQKKHRSSEQASHSPPHWGWQLIPPTTLACQHGMLTTPLTPHNFPPRAPVAGHNSLSCLTGVLAPQERLQLGLQGRQGPQVIVASSHTLVVHLCWMPTPYTPRKIIPQMMTHLAGPGRSSWLGGAGRWEASSPLIFSVGSHQWVPSMIFTCQSLCVSPQASPGLPPWTAMAMGALAASWSDSSSQPAEPFNVFL